MWQSQSVIPFVVFLFGLCIGSFLNVCISRIPEDLSIVSPGSRCPRCMKEIRAYDNIPVLSWLILQGKCRNCGLPISVMYPLVELATGLLFLLTYSEYGLTISGLKWVFFASLMVVLIVTDWRVRLLPDAVNWFGFGAGIALATRISPGEGLAAVLEYRFGVEHFTPLMVAGIGVAEALLGAAVGSGFLWAAGWAYRAWKGHEGMGMGDVKMMALLGSFLGVRGVFLVLLGASLVGTVVGIGNLGVLYATGWKRDVAERAARRGLGDGSKLRWELAKRYHIPFGTFLGLAGLAVAYVWPWIELKFVVAR